MHLFLMASFHVTAIVILFLPLLAISQRNDWRISRFGVEHGLSQNYVYCMYQDRKGFLWIGTRDGLNKFDGETFRVYRHTPGDTASLSDNCITSIAEDTRGTLWIGTRGGLNRFDRSAGTFRSILRENAGGHGLLTDNITALLADREGGLWVGTAHGLFYLRKRADTFSPLHFRSADQAAIAHNAITFIREGADGTIYVGTTWMCFRYNRIADAYEPLSEMRGARWVKAFMTTGTEGWWALAGADSLIGRKTRRSPTQELSISGGKVFHRMHVPRAAILDTAGAFWIASPTGLFRYRLADSSRSPYPVRLLERVSDANILSLYLDREHRLWVGTTSGLLKFESRGSEFALLPLFETSAGRFANSVRALCEDPEGDLWIGSDYGLHVLSRNGRTKFLFPGCLQHAKPLVSHTVTDAVNTIVREQDGTLLLGATGVILYNPRTRNIRRYLSRVRVWSICREDEDNIWVGTIGNGLFLLDRDWRVKFHFTHDVDDPFSIASDEILSLLRDRYGGLWIGTSSGLSRWNPATRSFFNYRCNPPDVFSIGGNIVWSLLEDRRGRIWIGTYGGGLAGYIRAEDRFQRITHQDGLPQNGIHGMVEDEQGAIWISSGVLLTRFLPDDTSFRRFDFSDGLSPTEFNFKSSVRLSDGRLCFGNSEGLTIFSPSRISDSPNPMRIVYGSLRVDGQVVVSELQNDTLIEIGSSQDYVTVEFSVPDFSAPGRGTVSCFLDGYDRKWRNIGTKRSVTYTNLDPKMYTLQLQASDDKGHRTGEVTSVRLSIIPPLWERTWLRGFVGLALGAGGVILIRRRIRTARDKERSRRALLESELQTLRAQMNPHFIFNTLTLVQHSLLHGDAEGAQTILGDFALLLRRLLEHSRQELAPIARELELLRAYIDLEAIRYDGEFRYELDVDPTLNGGWRMPTMIMQPIVENAIKHGLRPRGEGGILRVILRKAERSVIWCIEDNGIGRAAAEKMTVDSKGRSEPFGLRLTEERLKLLGKDLGTDASIKLIDLYGADGEPAGTRVVVTVPIQEAE